MFVPVMGAWALAFSMIDALIFLSPSPLGAPLLIREIANHPASPPLSVGRARTDLSKAFEVLTADDFWGPR